MPGKEHPTSRPKMVSPMEHPRLLTDRGTSVLRPVPKGNGRRKGKMEWRDEYEADACTPACKVNSAQLMRGKRTGLARGVRLYVRVFCCREQRRQARNDDVM